MRKKKTISEADKQYINKNRQSSLEELARATDLDREVLKAYLESLPPEALPAEVSVEADVEKSSFKKKSGFIHKRGAVAMTAEASRAGGSVKRSKVLPDYLKVLRPGEPTY